MRIEHHFLSLYNIESKCGHEEEINLGAYGKCEDTEDQKKSYGYMENEDEDEVVFMANEGYDEEVRGNEWMTLGFFHSLMIFMVVYDAC